MGHHYGVMRARANGWLLVACCFLSGCEKRATLLATLPANAPSFVGLVPLQKCAVSVGETGQTRCVSGIETLWSAALTGPVRQRPAAMGEVLVVANQAGELWGLAGADGKAAFHLVGQVAPVVGLAATSELVVVAGEKLVHAHGPDGAVKWKVELSAGLLEPSGGVIAAAVGDEIVGLSAESGEKKWSVSGKAAGLAGSTHGLFAQLHNGEVLAIDDVRGAVKWRVAAGEPVPETIVVIGETVWAGLASKEVVGLSVGDGHEMKRAKLRAAPAAAVTVAEPRLLVPLQGSDGCVASLLLATGASQGELCADHQLRGRVIADETVMLAAPRDGRVLVFRLPAIKN